MSPPALLGVRAFRITQQVGKGLVLGKQQPCFVGAGELLREALALQCGDPLLCSRCCVSVLACRAPRAWLGELFAARGASGVIPPSSRR